MLTLNSSKIAMLDLGPQAKEKLGDEKNEKTKVARINTHYSRTQCAPCCGNAREIDLTD